MFQRYAIYYTATGPFAAFGAAWLGWDIETGREVVHPDVNSVDLAELTQTPRKYGFHGTLKAPFRLVENVEETDLRDATQQLANDLTFVSLEGLEVSALGRFLALTPVGDQTALRALAGRVVTVLDPFRAALTMDELARRRKSNLSPEQEAHLLQWGYPHVLDQFRFHMTLTGRMPRADLDRVQEAVIAHFAPVLPTPFCLDALTLAGERADGRFEVLERFPI